MSVPANAVRGVAHYVNAKRKIEWPLNTNELISSRETATETVMCCTVVIIIILIVSMHIVRDLSLYC